MQRKRVGRPIGSKSADNRSFITTNFIDNRSRARVRETIELSSGCESSSSSSESENNCSDRKIANKPERENILPDRKPKNRLNNDRVNNLVESFDIIKDDLKIKIRNSSTIRAKCKIKNCFKPSKYRSPSSIKLIRFCEKHARAMIKSHPDLIDKFGKTLIKIKDKSTSTILIIDPESWREIPSCPVPSKELVLNYFPATPVNPKVYFHRNIMRQAFHMSRKGFAAQTVWEILKQRFISPLPKDIYRQFLGAVQRFCVWAVEEAEFKFDQKWQDKHWGYFCHCCFGDKNTRKTVVLILDGCFTPKSLKKEQNSRSSELDFLFYLPTTVLNSSERVNNHDEYCDNFRAGDNKTKAQAGIDVNGVFAAVCVHGFAYKIIDVAKGESLHYPKAKLVISISYDRNFAFTIYIYIILLFF